MARAGLRSVDELDLAVAELNDATRPADHLRQLAAARQAGAHALSRPAKRGGLRGTKYKNCCALAAAR